MCAKNPATKCLTCRMVEPIEKMLSIALLNGRMHRVRVFFPHVNDPLGKVCEKNVSTRGSV